MGKSWSDVLMTMCRFLSWLTGVSWEVRGIVWWRNIGSRFIMGRLIRGEGKELALCYIRMVEFIKGNGWIILSMVKVIRSFKMELFIRGHILMVNLKDMEFILGKMVRHIKGSGLMEWRMDREFGEVLQGTLILDNGKMDRQMDMEYIHGLMVIDMRVNLKIV